MEKILVKKNSDITILLTIFNRVDYTNKWLDYAEQSNVPFKIFISDGGNIKNIKKKLNLKKRKLDITYKKFKYYKNYNYFFEKYYLSVKKIKSKYIFIAEDDDYIFPNSIIKSARFLDNNRKFSCASGINCLGDFIRNNGKFLALSLRNESKEKTKSLLSNIPELRLIEFYSKKNVTIHNALHRKESLLKTFKILNSRNFLNLFVTELIFCLSVIYNGKVARINHIDYIKMDNTNLSSSANFEKLKSFSMISKTKNFKEENNLILKSIKFFDKKNKKIFLSLHDKSIERDRVLRIKEEIKKKSVFKKIRRIQKYVLTKLKIYYFIKYFYLSLFKADYFYKKVMVIDKSLTKIVKKDRKNFVKIVEFNRKYKF
jgi:glycosyltransferase domain-containing protein